MTTADAASFWQHRHACCHVRVQARSDFVAVVGSLEFNDKARCLCYGRAETRSVTCIASAVSWLLHTVGTQVHTNNNRWRRLLFVPKHSLGSSMTACQRGGPDSVTGYSTSNLWQTKWRFSQYYSFPCHYYSTNVPHSFAIYAICLSLTLK